MLVHFLTEINASKSKVLIEKHQAQSEYRKQKNHSLSAERNLNVGEMNLFTGLETKTAVNNFQ